MAKGKIIVAKVFVGIVCSILILCSIFMAVVLVAVSSHDDHNDRELTTTYDNLPNVMGDDGVYVAKNFFIENNFIIPKYVNFGYVKSIEDNSVYIRSENSSYDGRVKELEYYFTSYSQENSEIETKYITIYCDPQNIDKFQNKQKYNGYTYELTTEESISQDDDKIMQTHYYYTVNFNRNENTTKKCQLTMIVTIKHSKDIPSAEYKESSDKLFYSLLDNIVYRNV